MRVLFTLLTMILIATVQSCWAGDLEDTKNSVPIEKDGMVISDIPLPKEEKEEENPLVIITPQNLFLQSAGILPKMIFSKKTEED
ncbi:MAG: hypothetical protein KAT32_00195 [Candidatus Moranbacteria bacterium]|nr:hypothetical protein [Candidatus Moranbacteria bacterium]